MFILKWLVAFLKEIIADLIENLYAHFFRTIALILIAFIAVIAFITTVIIAI